MSTHLSREQINVLLEHRSAHCVSLFVPTARSGEAVEQAPIILKNLLAEAERDLRQRGLRAFEADALLQPARSLLGDSLFWQHQEEGLALFIDASGMELYPVPLELKPLAVVAEWFELMPLLPLMAMGDHFFVLALSRSSVRLFEATHNSIHAVEVPDMPSSQNEALAHDDREESLQFHTGSSSFGPGGQRPAIYHGQGTGIDTDKLDLLRFCQRVDRALSRHLADEQAPLILAAVGYVQPIYREANHYRHLVSRGIEGNPEALDIEQLHARALKLVEPFFREAEREAKARLGELRRSDRVIEAVERIVPAAHWGRIDTLFVELDQHVWGRFDAEANQVQVHRGKEPEPGDFDLLDFAVRRTLAKGGTVFALDRERMPGKAPAAAICRY
jgi:hypothetical protein